MLEFICLVQCQRSANYSLKMGAGSVTLYEEPPDFYPKNINICLEFLSSNTKNYSANHFGDICVLVTFAFGWNLSFYDFSVLLTFAWWWQLNFGDKYVLVTFAFCWPFVLVTLHFRWHFRFIIICIFVLIGLWWHLRFSEILVLVTFAFKQHMGLVV